MSDYKRLDKTGLTTLLNRLSEVLGGIFNAKADKVSGAVNGNIASLDSNGNVKDSGKTLGKSVPSDALFTDAKAEQANTTTSADYRLLLSDGANDTTETKAARKSAKFKANPSTGVLSVGNDLVVNGKSQVKGTNLTSTNDLNSITDAGIYFLIASNCPSNTPVASITGKLSVSYDSVNTVTYQLLERSNGDNGQLWFRRKSSTSWSAWQCFGSNIYGTLLTSSSNLNDIVTPGIYKWDGISAPTGAPASLNSEMYVSQCGNPSGGGSESISQLIVIPAIPPRIYIRRRYNNSWNDFILLSYGGLDGVLLTSSDNLNDIVTPGIYKWADTSYPTNAPNPTTTNCAMEVIQSAPNPTDKTVFQIVYSQAKMYFRRKYNGTWYAWDEFISTGNLQSMLYNTKLWTIVQSLMANVATPKTYPLQNFAKIKQDRATITVTTSSTAITSTQTSSYYCGSVVGNKTDGIDCTLYTKLNITGYNSGTTYGNPYLNIGFADSADALQAAAEQFSAPACGYYKGLGFTSTSSTVYTFDIKDLLGVKYIGLFNTFTKYTITKIELAN